MKLLMVVPYRNREKHLRVFIPHITNTLYNQNICNQLVVVEQDNNSLFNRGLLCNIGFYYYHHKYDYVIFHDVDMICENIDYSYCSSPASLLRYRSKHNFKRIHDHYFGGITLFPVQDFIKINGFSNEYWGWGGEDDDLRIRCEIYNLSTITKPGKCNDLETESMKNKIHKNKNYKYNLKKINEFKKHKDINSIKNDGLSNIQTKYSLTSISENNLFTMIKVSI